MKNLKKYIIGIALLIPFVTYAAGLTVPQGGTGNTSLTSTQILFGNGTSPIGTSSKFTWDGTTVGINDGLILNGITLNGSTGRGVFGGGAASSVLTAIGGSGYAGSFQSILGNGIEAYGLVYGISSTGTSNYFSGSVGIGTTSANKKLSVNLGTTDALRFIYNNSTGTESTYMDTTLASDGGITYTGVGSSPDFTFSHDVLVPDEVYGAGWNGSLEVPTKNAVYDKIQTIAGATPGGSDTQVQFNDSSAFGGDSGLVFNKTTNALTITGAGTTTGKSFIYTNSAALERFSVLDNGQVNMSLSPTAMITWSFANGVGVGTTDKAGLDWLWSGSAGSRLRADNASGSVLGDLVYYDTTSGSEVERFRVTRAGNVTVSGVFITQNAQFSLTTGSAASKLYFQRYPGGTKGDVGSFLTFSGTGNDQYARLTFTSTTNSGRTAGDPGIADIRFDNSDLIVRDGIAGIGVTSPTATLHLRAGTATANTAPLQFNSGTLETTARAGLHEYNGNHYITNVGLLRMPLGGTLFDHYADATVGGAEADIYTDTLVANTFNGNGDKVIASYGGNFVTGGTELTQLKVYLAGTAVWDSTGVAPTTGTTSWRVYVELIRVSSSIVRYTVSLNTTGASGFVYAVSGELTGLTLSGTNILKITGTSSGVGSGSGDIVGKMGYVEFSPAK